MFTDLPNDILILIFERLDPSDFASLSETCRAFYHIVNDLGWSSYLRKHSRPSLSLHHAKAYCWSPRFQVRYDTLTDRAWQHNEFVARPLSPPWTNKFSPLLAVSVNRLLVAAGNTLHSYAFGRPSTSHDNTIPTVQPEVTISLSEGHQRAGDITALRLVSSDGVDDLFLAAFHDGIIEYLKITAASEFEPPTVARYYASAIPPNDFAESLSFSAEHNLLLSLSSSGSASLAHHRDRINSGSHSPYELHWSSTVDLKARGWASYLCTTSSTPYAAFGTSLSPTPLILYNIPDGQSTSSAPSTILGPGADINTACAVYGLTRSPPCSPWGSSPEIIVSGWYDGKVRCYDLRTPVCTSQSPISTQASATSIPTLSPVLSLYNPWSYEPIYCVSSGGGSGAHIGAGSARHSVLSFWDIRAPAKGWSVHAPGNDPSPVYDVILESSRCFGVTQSRPFVYDFGPGVTIDTYPSVSRTSTTGKPKSRKKSGQVGYYVTQYLHSRGSVSSEH